MVNPLKYQMTYKIISVREYSRNLGQRSILARKGTYLLKKDHKNSPPPTHSISFLSVLHQNKALHNFPNRGQSSIVERNIGLEYALSVVKQLYFL